MNKRIEVVIKLRLDTFQFDSAFKIINAIYAALKTMPDVASIINISIRKP